MSKLIKRNKPKYSIRFQSGGKYTNEDAEVDNSTFEQQAFIENWLNNRTGVLQNNVKSMESSSIPHAFKKTFSIDSYTNDIRNEQINNARTAKVYNGNSPYRLNEYINSYDNNVLHRQKYGNNTMSAKEVYLNSPGVEGAYKPSTHTVRTSKGTSPSIMLHEKTHSLNAVPQLQAIERIFKDKPNKDSYYDSGSEIYSRLMEFRSRNKLNPSKVYNSQDVKGLRKSSTDFNILDRYNDSEVQQLLNTVASNKSKTSTVG